MKILVINAGSSSLKYQLIDMDNEQMLAKGNCEKIGLEMGIFGHKTADGREKKIEICMKNHTEAFEQVKNALLDSEVGVISDLSDRPPHRSGRLDLQRVGARGRRGHRGH